MMEKRTKRKKISSVIALFTIFALITPFLISLTGCSFMQKVGDFSNSASDKNFGIIDDYLKTGEAVDVNIDPKFDTYSAEDAINGEMNSSSMEYYDPKSDSYVSAGQARANSWADALKMFWVPACVVTIFFGFLIRRLNHSSATLRKFGFFLEVIFPIVLTIFVYIFCYLADSSIVSFFDGLF